MENRRSQLIDGPCVHCWKCEIGQCFIQMQILTQLIRNKGRESTMLKVSMAMMLLACGPVWATKAFYLKLFLTGGAWGEEINTSKMVMKFWGNFAQNW